MSLHVHSEFSSLDGWSTCDEIGDRMVEMDCPYCGLTDHGVVSGHIDFDKAMRSRGITPVFGCLMAGQSIVTSEGRKNVEDIRVGDLVLTHSGRFRPVTRVMQRPYRGQGFDIQIAQTKRTLRLTEEHPILVREISGEVTWKKPGDIEPTVKWEGGGNLNGPSVCLPKLEDGPAAIDVLDWLPEYFETNELGHIGRRKRKKGDRDCWWPAIPPMILLSPEIARFLGLYVAEGSAQANGQIIFTFNINEDEYAQFIHAVLQSFQVDAKIYRRPDKSIQEVVACNVPLALMLRELCGVGALSKHVPPPIFNSNRQVREAFLTGVDQGDGKKTTSQKMIKVGSRDLCWGLRVILADLGHWTSVVDLGPRSHQIQWSPDATYKRTREDDQYLYRMISSITPCDIDCDVYNFEVDEDNSYVSDFILHNCELYHGIKFGDDLQKGEKDQRHLIALAVTDEGVKNLWRLVNSTASREKFHNVGRVSNEDIIKYKDGLIITSACPLGHVPQGLLRDDYTMLNWYHENLGDNFRIEVTTYPGDTIWHDMDSEENEIHYTPQQINERLVEVANERGIAVTYGDDGHYAFPSQYEYHDMYLAAQTKQSIYTPSEERKQFHPEGAVCIKDQDTVREALAYLGKDTVSEIIANTNAIGEMADGHLPTVDRPHMPVFIPKECPWTDEHQKEKTAPDLFEELVATGIAERYEGDENEEAAYDKAVHEVDVLTKGGLEHYFLMTWDLMQYCKANEIETGPGRGSSAGSIVAYALGITDIDPLYYKLFFERFWNEGRAKGFPDIDTDFPTSRRGDIREYLIERWGADKVCSIGTITRMKPISVIEKMGKACEITYVEEQELKKIVRETPKIEIHGVDQIGWNPELEPTKEIYVKDHVGDQIDEWIVADEKREPFRERYVEMCEQACSRNSTYGIHASGIVISDIPLDAYAPAYLRGGKETGIPATMFPMSVIEKLMLIKEDVLGLKTLDTLEEWKRLYEKKGEQIEWSHLDKEEYPDEMWDLLDEGFVAGVFQVETPTGKSLCERLKPRSIEELGVLVALVRPGPDEEAYLARKEGREPITYPHPLLEPVLEESLGVFIYQEQIISFMNALGYSKGDADHMRKVLGKKLIEQFDEMVEGKGEWENNGIKEKALAIGFTEDGIIKLCEELKSFASYSFNKSHAIAYAVVGFRCLLAKYLAPEEWYIACIRTVEPQKRAELTPKYIKEARRAGIKVLPPHVHYSQAECDVYEGNIYFGFSDIKGVGIGGPYFVELRELGLQVDTPEHFKAELEAYNDVALEEKKALKEAGELPPGWKSPKLMLNTKKIDLIAEAGAWDELEGSVDLKVKQEKEKELLMVVLTDFTEAILAEHEKAIAKCDTFADALTPWTQKEELYMDQWMFDDGDEVPMTKRFIDYKLPGIISSVRPTKTKATGKSMGIVTIEFGRHELTFACFSHKWPKSKFMFKPHNVGIFTVRHTPPNSGRPESYHFEAGRLLQ